MTEKQLATKIVNTAGNVLLSPPWGGFNFFVNHGPRSERKIALTFDDGPVNPSTKNLLDAMEELNVLGTFFCVGWQVRANSDLVRRIDKAGHVIGNHSMDHSRKGGLRIHGGAHIDDSAQEIAAVLGRRPLLYRPPWGWLTPWEGLRLRQRGYAVIGWDVYTLDWKLPEIDGHTIGEGICRDVQPGSIILLHDAYAMVAECHKQEMVRAVEYVVPRLRDQGYTFVTIPDLLKIPAYAAVK
jgi:peptidoglycan-N-acetylglucosamine deacetylase